MTIEIVVLGAGGHARVVADALLAAGRAVRGFIDADPAKRNTLVLDLPVLGGDEVLDSLSPEKIELANGIGSAGSMDLRAKVYTSAKARGFRFATVQHPAATVARSARLGEGAQVLARAVVQPCAVIGPNSIVNTAAVVEHDVQVGAHVHISPGCILAGEVQIEDLVHVGVGAVVIQRMKVGTKSFVAAGAVVTADVPAGVRVMGVPARASS